MIKTLLAQNEGKTLEFKENVRSTQNVLRTAVAFANTAGGILVFGVRDRTKEVVGVKNALEDEERNCQHFFGQYQAHNRAGNTDSFLAR